jgi:hypothetical protein
MDQIADRVAGDGALATLPWRSYRAFSWGSGLASSDPAVRWFDTDVVVDDDLPLGTGVVVRGENERARRVGSGLEGARPADALARAGIDWALVYLDDPAAGDLDLTGLDPVVHDDVVALYAVPGAAEVGAPGPTTAERVAVVLVMLLAGTVVLLGVGVATWSRIAVKMRRSATLRTEERETA